MEVWILITKWKEVENKDRAGEMQYKCWTFSLNVFPYTCVGVLPKKLSIWKSHHIFRGFFSLKKNTLFPFQEEHERNHLTPKSRDLVQGYMHVCKKNLGIINIKESMYPMQGEGEDMTSEMYLVRMVVLKHQQYSIA